jgi:hypothetical protein
MKGLEPLDLGERALGGQSEQGPEKDDAERRAAHGHLPLVPLDAWNVR